MPDTFQLEIVTPEKKVVTTAAEEVQIPGKGGYLGILPGHAPLITELAVGEITFRDASASSSSEQRLAVAWGFAEVLPDKVTILAETALHPNEIDRAEAQKELQEGEKLWQEAGDDGEKYDEANAITRQAEEKIASAEGKST